MIPQKRNSCFGYIYVSGNSETGNIKTVFLIAPKKEFPETELKKNINVTLNEKSKIFPKKEFSF